MSPTLTKRAKSLVLTLILLGQLMIVLDASVINTALPTIKRSLGFSDSSLTWIQNAYTLTFGGLLLLGARMGDILGRRRVFVWGIAGFSLASLAGGISQSPAELLIARAIQGVAAAAAAPSTLALLQQTFREPKERARALSLFSAVLSAGISVGMLVGGVLTEFASWRWSLFINVPIGAVLVMLAPRFLEESERRTGSFDLRGAVSSTLGMTLFVYGFVRAADKGWSDQFTIASFVLGVGLLALFILNERRVAQPITPLHLFASRERTGANITRLVLIGGIGSMWYFVSQFTQVVLHFSPLQAGMAFLPQTLVILSLSQILPKYVMHRVSPYRMAVTGLGIATLGMILLTRIGPGVSYFPTIFIPLLILGVGMGTAFIPLTGLALAGVSHADAGAASGLVNVTQQVGSTLGLAILINVFKTQPDFGDGVHDVVIGAAVFLGLAFLSLAFIARTPSVRSDENTNIEIIEAA